MPELVQVAEDIYYLEDEINHGIIHIGGRKCVVIDSGLLDDNAMTILAALEAAGLELHTIINTHSHADHYGGNDYLVGKTGCKVCAPSFEAAIMQNPTLESLYIFGASPPSELTQPFLLAKKSPVDTILDEGNIVIGEKELKIISLKGHSPNQIGIMVDDVLFCADSLFSLDAWRKFLLVYAVNIGDMIDSIETVKKSGARSFIPSHAAPTGDIIELAEVEHGGARLEFHLPGEDGGPPLEYSHHDVGTDEGNPTSRVPRN